MPCIVLNNAIICTPQRRKFRYKNKFYFVESTSYSVEISNENGDGLFVEDFKKRKRSKFYKEMEKGV